MTAQPSDAGGVLVTRLLYTALRHRVLVLGCAFLAFAVVASTLFRPRMWMSSSAFVPQASAKGPGNLSGIAAQFGVSLPNISDATQGPMFFADMLKSRSLLEGLAATKFEYQSADGPVSGDLYSIYEIEGDSLLRREKMLKILTRDVNSGMSVRTGVVRLEVTAPHPVLAQKMNDRLLALLSEFNTNTRQSQAGAERKYAATQLADAKAQLGAAEYALEGFLQRNASFAGSERLKLEVARLQREVTHRQGLYSALAGSYEQARLEEVRDTPQLSIIERPEMPALPKTRSLFVRAPLALLIGGAVGLILAALIDVWRSLPTIDGAGFDALRDEWRAATGRSRRPPQHAE